MSGPSHTRLFSRFRSTSCDPQLKLLDLRFCRLSYPRLKDAHRRHLLSKDLLKDQAAFRLAGNEARAGFSPGEHQGPGPKTEPALLAQRAMARSAVPQQNRDNVVLV